MQDLESLVTHLSHEVMTNFAHAMMFGSPSCACVVVNFAAFLPQHIFSVKAGAYNIVCSNICFVFAHLKLCEMHMT